MKPQHPALSPRRALAVARKELRHILRDPFTLGLALGLPLFMVVVFGVAIDLDAKDIRLAVDDRDRSASSRQLVQAFENSGKFVIQPIAAESNPVERIGAERSAAVLIIEPNFEKKLAAGLRAPVQIVLDGADNTTSGSILSYLQGIQAAANNRLAPAGPAPPVELVTRYLFNGELASPNFIVPGLTVVIVGIISILLTALTVAREWENGSMEMLLSTPIRPIEFILGKLVPYNVLGLLAVAVIYLAARLFFGVPFRGNHLVFLAGCFLFLTAYLAQGLLISVVTRSQLVAMQLAMVSGLLPSTLLSGFIFPIESMPLIFRWLTAILPARWFMVITRSVFLKGSGAGELWLPFLALTGLTLVLVVAAAKRFKQDLEP
jgi:ABC-2 type transport system permease protein